MSEARRVLPEGASMLFGETEGRDGARIDIVTVQSSADEGPMVLTPKEAMVWYIGHRVQAGGDAVVTQDTSYGKDSK